jgi:ketosteroid isomerase-like protein
MKRLRPYWIPPVVFAFILGAVAEEWFRVPLYSADQFDRNVAAMTGIKKLHDLDQRVTLLNDPKALSGEWTEDAVRLTPDAPPDVGKSAIFSSDERSIANAPGSAIGSYRPEIRDVRVVGDWAFEWGVFEGGYREAANKPVETIHGKVLRVLRRESNGEWKFARVMVALDSKHASSFEGGH